MKTSSFLSCPNNSPNPKGIHSTIIVDNVKQHKCERLEPVNLWYFCLTNRLKWLISCIKHWEAARPGCTVSSSSPRVSALMDTMCVAGLSPGCNICHISHLSARPIFAVALDGNKNLYLPQETALRSALQIPESGHGAHYRIIIWINSSARLSIIHGNVSEVNNKRLRVLCSARDLRSITFYYKSF